MMLSVSTCSIVLLKGQVLILDTVKATDENLTSENWELILDVCDKVSTQENGYAWTGYWKRRVLG